MDSALVSDTTSTKSESEAADGLRAGRSLRIGAWLAAGGATALLVVACVVGAVIWLLIGIGPRFTSAQLALPLQQTLWDAYSKPKTTVVAAEIPAELGVLLRPTADGTIVGLRFYKAAGDDGPHVGSVWSPKGKLLASVTFANETDAGWQEALFATPLPVEADRLLVASYFSNAGGLMTVLDDGAPTKSGSPVFRLPPSDSRPANVFHAGESGFPSTDAGERAVWVDVVFVPATAER